MEWPRAALWVESPQLAELLDGKQHPISYRSIDVPDDCVIPVARWLRAGSEDFWSDEHYDWNLPYFIFEMYNFAEKHCLKRLRNDLIDKVVQRASERPQDLWPAMCLNGNMPPSPIFVDLLLSDVQWPSWEVDPSSALGELLTQQFAYHLSGNSPAGKALRSSPKWIEMSEAEHGIWKQTMKKLTLAGEEPLEPITKLDRCELHDHHDLTKHRVSVDDAELTTVELAAVREALGTQAATKLKSKCIPTQLAGRNVSKAGTGDK